MKLNEFNLTLKRFGKKIILAQGKKGLRTIISRMMFSNNRTKLLYWFNELTTCVWYRHIMVIHHNFQIVFFFGFFLASKISTFHRRSKNYLSTEDRSDVFDEIIWLHVIKFIDRPKHIVVYPIVALSYVLNANPSESKSKFV